MKSRSLVLIVAVAVVLAVLSTAMTSAGPRITLRYWHLFGGPDVEIMNTLVAQFQRERPEIAIEAKYGVWTNYYDQLMAAIAGGNPPNIAIIHSRHLPAFASDTVLEPLGEHLHRLGLKADDFMTVPWTMSWVGSRQWGLPLDQIMPVVLFYNTDLFRQAGLAEPPQDGTEFISMARTIRERTGKWGVAIPIGGFPIYRLWFSALYQNGGRLLSQDLKRAGFNTSAGVEALRYWVDVVHRHQVSPSRAIDVLQGFTARDVAMILDGGWWYLGLIGQKDLNFRMTAIPAFFAGSRAFFSNTHNFVVPKQRREDPQALEASLTFIKWLSDHSRSWGDTGGFVPARKSIAFGSDYRQSVFGRLYLDLLPFGIYAPPIKQNLKIEDVLIRHIEAAMLQRESPEEALSRAEQEVNALLR